MNWKSLIYPLLPSWGRAFHAKRRKGLWYRHVPAGVLECQTEQDRIFWRTFLRAEGGGSFWEVGAGGGVVGSHTLGLELHHGWKGLVWEPSPRPRQNAQIKRRCQVPDFVDPLARAESPDLVAIHRPGEFPEIWKSIQSSRLRPRWVIVENRDPDPRWCRLLAKQRYSLKFYFHDDEYYELRN